MQVHENSAAQRKNQISKACHLGHQSSQSSSTYIPGVLSQTLSPPITSRFKCLTNGCCDQHEWCRFWASIGECQINEEWMSGNCQLACGTCMAGPATHDSWRQ
ncbi:shTK domain protein [Cooperia oncophora]